MSSERLIYLPLGGAGEIGMNAYVYGYGPEGAERLIVVDLGVSFPDMDSTPGVDLILPDISWLIAQKHRIEEDWFECPFEYNQNGSQQGIDFKALFVSWHMHVMGD